MQKTRIAVYIISIIIVIIIWYNYYDFIWIKMSKIFSTRSFKVYCFITVVIICNIIVIGRYYQCVLERIGFIAQDSANRPSSFKSLGGTSITPLH